MDMLGFTFDECLASASSTLAVMPMNKKPAASLLYCALMFEREGNAARVQQYHRAAIRALKQGR